jgi:hypothetical protein
MVDGLLLMRYVIETFDRKAKAEPEASAWPSSTSESARDS